MGRGKGREEISAASKAKEKLESTVQEVFRQEAAERMAANL